MEMTNRISISHSQTERIDRNRFPLGGGHYPIVKPGTGNRGWNPGAELPIPVVEKDLHRSDYARLGSSFPRGFESLGRTRWRSLALASSSSVMTIISGPLPF